MLESLLIGKIKKMKWVTEDKPNLDVFACVVYPSPQLHIVPKSENMEFLHLYEYILSEFCTFLSVA